MIDIRHKKITVLGAQKSGLALLRLIDRFHGIGKLSDKGCSACLTTEIRSWLSEKNILLEENGHTRSFIEDSDYVILSPGVRVDSDPVIWAKEKNIIVLGEIEFAYQFCSNPVIAVTGSNGKTTTTTLIHKVLEKAGLRSCLCGNIGFPFSQAVLENKETDFFVCEISSFQLESLFPLTSDYKNKGLKGFKPYIAVFINFNQNHLDRHKDLNEYFEAKAKVFQNQDQDDFAVLNAQEERMKLLSKKILSCPVFFDGHATNPNQAAVIAVADILKIKRTICENVFKEFKGVEHRLEFIREFQGVDYINDSKATTVDSGRWALKSMEKPVVMICGGSNKNLDYGELKDLVKKKVKKMIVLGEIKELLEQTFKDATEVELASGFDDAIVRAKNTARPGDCILLSPMTASYDMFKNFEERGQTFKKIVMALK